MPSLGLAQAPTCKGSTDRIIFKIISQIIVTPATTCSIACDSTPHHQCVTVQGKKTHFENLTNYD